jgi:hypothetical protein
MLYYNIHCINCINEKFVIELWGGNGDNGIDTRGNRDSGKLPMDEIRYGTKQSDFAI